MNAELILKTDVLDIVFENRNKQYGAYALRRSYHQRMKRSLLLVFLMVTVFCVYAMMPGKQMKEINTYVYEDPSFAPPPPPEKPVEKLIKKSVSLKVRTQKLLSSIVVAKQKDSVPEIKDLPDNIRIGSTDILDGINNPQLQTPEIPDVAEGKITESKATNQNEVMDAPDVQPQFPGGMNALRTFLERNLQNPKDLEEGDVVAVKVKFVVGYDGVLRGFEIVQDGGTDFNNEVIRVLKKMPGWIPGKSNGKNVSVYYTIPVKFVSND